VLYTRASYGQQSGAAEREGGGAMTFNLYEAYLVAQERRTDDRRDAERWRLIKSVKKHGGSPGWLQRLGRSLRRLVPVHPDGGTGEPRPGPHQTVSSPTH
jgi:hypothetical protein